MVSAGLTMLTDAVCMTGSNLIAVANLQVEQEPVVRPITEIMCSQIDSSSFSQLSQTAMTYLRLAYYRNQLLHLFVEDAMLALCLIPERDYGIFSSLHEYCSLNYDACSNCSTGVLCCTLCTGLRVYFAWKNLH